MSLALGLLPYIGPLIAWFITNILRNRALSEAWVKSYEGWLKREQNRIAIAAAEKQRVRDQVAGLKKMREERKKGPPSEG